MNTNTAAPDKDRPGDVLPVAEPTVDGLVIPPMIAHANEAFLRDWPELLKTHCDEWVAYHGDKFYGFAKDKTVLYQRCLHDGLNEEEFVVCYVDSGSKHRLVGPIYVPDF